MRISDWSSDVCSSDLAVRDDAQPRALSEGAQMLANRLRKNLRNIKSWRAREGVECFRAYDADLPEYAAAIDVYPAADDPDTTWLRSEEHTSELQSLMRI